MILVNKKTKIFKRNYPRLKKMPCVCIHNSIDRELYGAQFEICFISVFEAAFEKLSKNEFLSKKF